MNGRDNLEPGGPRIDVWKDCKAARLHVDRHNSRKVALGYPGILATYAVPKDGLPGLLLLADEPDYQSLSVAKCAIPAASTVLQYLEPGFPGGYNICTETEAGVEWLAVTWGRSLPRAGTAVPVRWPETPPGSRSAFLGVFGIQARRVLRTMEMLRRNPWRPTFP